MNVRSLICMLILATPAHAAYDFRVIDGDTLNVPTGYVKGMPKRISIRLVGINTPETGSRAQCDQERSAGEAAKLYVRDRLTTGKKIKVGFVRWDKYGGRVAGRVTIDGRDLSADLVSAGFAVPYLRGPRVNVWCKS